MSRDGGTPSYLDSSIHLKTSKLKPHSRRPAFKPAAQPVLDIRQRFKVDVAV